MLLDFNFTDYVWTQLKESSIDLDSIKSYRHHHSIDEGTFTPRHIITFKMKDDSTIKFPINFSAEMIQDLNYYGKTIKADDDSMDLNLEKYLRRSINLNILLGNEETD